MAADPDDPWVYVAVTRYGAPECGRCPDAAIMIERSADGGKTWSKARPLCRCAGHGWQADPILEVVPDTGAVYALWLIGLGHLVLTVGRPREDVVGSRLHEGHGRLDRQARPDRQRQRQPCLCVVERSEWRRPVDRAFARRRRHVDKAEGGRLATVLLRLRRRDAAGRNRRLRAVEHHLLRSRGHPTSRAVKHHAVVSHDGGATWNNVVVDSVRIGVPCTTNFCSSDYYIGHSSIAATTTAPW